MDPRHSFACCQLQLLNLECYSQSCELHRDNHEWWLILSTSLGCQVSRYLVNMILGVSVGWFQMRLAFELVDGVKQIFIPSVVVTQSCLTLQPPWTRECQAPLSMEFSRQEYWNELPCPSLGDIPDPGIEPRSPALQVDSLSFELLGKPPQCGGPHLISWRLE